MPPAPRNSTTTKRPTTVLIAIDGLSASGARGRAGASTEPVRRAAAAINAAQELHSETWCSTSSSAAPRSRPTTRSWTVCSLTHAMLEGDVHSRPAEAADFRDNRRVGVVRFACALGCLVTAVVARPAGAAMTLVLRDERGFTQTFHQEGSRVRATNVTIEDDGEAWIVDVKDGRVLLVYDDAKAYYDFSKAVAQIRGAAEKLRKADMRRKRRESGGPRFVPQHETRR